jgi:hypothetical protein
VIVPGNTGKLQPGKLQTGKLLAYFLQVSFKHVVFFADACALEIPVHRYCLQCLLLLNAMFIFILGFIKRDSNYHTCVLFCLRCLKQM